MLLHVKISFFFLSEQREAAEQLKREKETAIMNALLLCYRQMHNNIITRIEDNISS
jgi:hypothetical protein